MRASFLTLTGLIFAFSVDLGDVATASAQQEATAKCANEGNAFSLDDQIAGCTAVIEAAHAASPPNASVEAAAFYNRANKYLRKSDAKRAIQDYSQAIRLNPSYVQAFVNRSIANRAIGETASAIADYRQSVKLDASFSTHGIGANTLERPMFPVFGTTVADVKLGNYPVDIPAHNP